MHQRRLFFKSTDESSKRRKRRTLQAGMLGKLKSANISLPIVLDYDDPERSLDETLVVRFMKTEDLSDILPLCISEFGDGPTAGLVDLFKSLGNIPRWWDRVYFEPSISMALQAKMNANLKQEHSKCKEYRDPAVLVLCMKKKNPTPGSRVEKVVGMVELSLQPPEADKNPPTYPLPVWFKNFYCRISNQTPQGWVTNLLVDPEYRGMGYSKVLMSATEGVAKSWGNNFIYLHADANERSGKVPQRLYETLGYEVVKDEEHEFAWLNGASQSMNPFSNVRMIQGVPLLCYRKQIQ